MERQGDSTECPLWCAQNPLRNRAVCMSDWLEIARLESALISHIMAEIEEEHLSSTPKGNEAPAIGEGAAAQGAVAEGVSPEGRNKSPKREESELRGLLRRAPRPEEMKPVSAYQDRLKELLKETFRDKWHLPIFFCTISSLVYQNKELYELAIDLSLTLDHVAHFIDELKKTSLTAAPWTSTKTKSGSDGTSRCLTPSRESPVCLVRGLVSRGALWAVSLAGPA
ncbi:uncharacterized protein [Paramormyrops kingsleyae]|uniref:uncharacterized protein n=1 Tax=Paramormyrops kingsleyae TaxID=1676925 RepID=UPI003B976EDB